MNKFVTKVFLQEYVVHNLRIRSKEITYIRKIKVNYRERFNNPHSLLTPKIGGVLKYVF